MQKPQTRHSFGPHEKAGNCVDKRRPFHGSFVAIPRSPLCSALAGRGLRVCSDMIDRSRCACCEGVLDNVCSSVPGWRTMAAVGGLGSSARFGSRLCENSSEANTVERPRQRSGGNRAGVAGRSCERSLSESVVWHCP